MTIEFLTYNEIVSIHTNQLELYGGLIGIRTSELLKSALGQPSATFNGNYLHEDLFQMAAAYLYHIVQNHPFTDGNKRVGFVAALVFLQVNGYVIAARTEETENMVLGVASGRILKPEIATWLRQHTR